MSIRTKLISFSSCVLLLFTHLGCEQSAKKKNGIFESNRLTIDQDFSSEALNDKVLISTKLREADLKRPNLKDYLLKHTTVANPKKSVIALGNYQEYPEGWFYIQLVNAGHTTRRLVIEELNHLRCDAMGVFTFNLGKIQ